MKIFSFMFGLILLCGNAFALVPSVVKFATEATYPPFVYMTPAGQIEGFDADIVRALCQEMKRTCTLSNQPWESLIPSLKLKKFDALFGGMAITAEREKEVDFTDPYYHLTGSFVGDQSHHLVISAEGLKGKTIGVQAGTTFDTYLQNVYGSAITINRYPSLQNALMDLKADRLDTVLGDTPVIQQWVKENGQGQFVVMGNAIQDEKYFGRGDAIAVRKGDHELLQALNNALAGIKKNGTYCKLIKKHFGDASCLN